MKEEEFLAMLTEALELDSGIGLDDDFRDYDEWDSMMFLALVTLMYDRYNYSLTPEVFGEIDTWRDLYHRISQ